MNAFLTGVLAGYGIAIPVGAIAVLIIDAGLRYGFQSGFWAGAGAASADLLYAVIAVIVGGTAVTILGSFVSELQLASGVLLLALGLAGLWKLGRTAANTSPTPAMQSTRNIYVLFLGLTLLNPMTIVYFAALILGGAAGSEATVVSRALFVIGAGVASLTWQTFLAASASLFHKRLSARMTKSLSALGNLLVCGFGANILITFLAHVV